MATSYRCFLCHDADNLFVTVQTSARVIQRPDQDSEAELLILDDAEREWDRQSIMWCGCGASDGVAAFEEEPDGTA